MSWFDKYMSNCPKYSDDFLIGWEKSAHVGGETEAEGARMGKCRYGIGMGVSTEHG
jgi:hypothetical protein